MKSLLGRWAAALAVVLAALFLVVAFGLSFRSMGPAQSPELVLQPSLLPPGGPTPTLGPRPTPTLEPTPRIPPSAPVYIPPGVTPTATPTPTPTPGGPPIPTPVLTPRLPLAPTPGGPPPTPTRPPEPKTPPDIPGLEVGSIDEARRHVQFDILVPSYMPQGTRLAKIAIQDGWVRLLYLSPFGPFTVFQGVPNSPEQNTANLAGLAKATGGYSVTLNSGAWFVMGPQPRVDIDMGRPGDHAVIISTFPVRCAACDRVEGVRTLMGEELEAAQAGLLGVASSLVAN